MGAHTPGTGSSTLLVVGDTEHRYDDAGRLCTHSALAAQIDCWAAAFDRTRFAGVLVRDPRPDFSPYRDPAIELVALPRAGGPGWRGKGSVVVAAPIWVARLSRLLRDSQAVHLRCPCNVTLVAIPLARLLARRRYALYAGSWSAYEGEALSYRLQRWMLRRIFGGTVHVYADPQGAPNLRPFFSSSYWRADVEAERNGVQARCRAIEHAGGLPRPVRLVSVGAFSANKDQATIVRAVARLGARGLPVEAVLIGDGPRRAATQALAAELGVGDRVTFRGHQDPGSVREAYRWGHLNVLASHREGFPKVVLEGLAHGAIPVTGPFAASGLLVSEGGRGAVFVAGDPESLAATIEALAGEAPAALVARIRSGYAYALEHTLDAFAAEVDRVTTGWGLHPERHGGHPPT